MFYGNKNAFSVGEIRDGHFRIFYYSRIAKPNPEYPKVSNKNFSKILASNGWHPGPGKVGQGGPKVFHL